MLGIDVTRDGLPGLDAKPRPSNFVGIKSPMFSFTRLLGADPVLGVEMASTGEVACFGSDKHEAFLKALLASNFTLPKAGILVTLTEDLLHRSVHAIYKLSQLGYKLYATPATSAFLTSCGIDNESLPYPVGETAENLLASPLLSVIKERKVDLVINAGSAAKSLQPVLDYHLRRTAVDFGVPLLTNINLVNLFADAMEKHTRSPMVGLVPHSLEHYYRGEKPTDAWTSPVEFH